MEIFGFVADIIAGINHPFWIGVISSVTPCTIAIFPIFLYRFGLWNKEVNAKRNYVGLAMAAAGFLLSFTLAGLVLQQIILSSFANVLRLLLGTVIVFIGMLQVLQRLNLQTVSKFSNPFLLGAFLPWLLSFSPCVLFFSALLFTNASSVTAAQQASTAFQFFLFALGMLTPVIVFVIGGNGLLRFVQRRSGKVFQWFEKISSWLIILAGLYLSSQLVQITSSEVLAAGFVGTLLGVAFITRVILREKLTGANYLVGVLLFLTMISTTMVAVAITQPYDELAVSDELLAYLCVPGEHDNSPIALPLALLMAGNAFLIAIWYRFSDRLKRYKLSLEIVQR